MQRKMEKLQEKIRRKLNEIKQNSKVKLYDSGLTKDDNVYLSFGENCLTDDMLERFRIKSFTSPYSWGRMNVEYILQIEKGNYRDFLNPKYLYYGKTGEKRVVRLKKYNRLNNEYDESVMKGFEFTHHDLIKNRVLIKKFERRIERMKHLTDKNLYIFYHHRYCETTRIDQLVNNLHELKEIYEKKTKHTELIVFSQIIVDNPIKRKVTHMNIDGMHVYVFYTTKIWAGHECDENIFWGRCDDDLFKIMIDDVKNGFKMVSVPHCIDPTKRRGA